MAFFTGQAAAAESGKPAPSPRVTDRALAPDERIRLADECAAALKQGLLEVWYPRCVDTEWGGFLCDFDHRWRPTGPHDKMLPFQARQTWVAAKAAGLYPEDDRYLAAARHGFSCLWEIMWDREHGGWYWILDRKGKPRAPWQGAKHAYGTSFGIYATSAYYAATRDPAGLKLAQEAFAWLEKHAHDERNGGYHEFYTRAGTPIMSARENPFSESGPADVMGNPVGLKSMNSHIHLLEAMTELVAVWPDPMPRKRLKELFHIVRDRITVPPGAMHLYFHPNWTPIPDHDSYGHDVETAFLLLEAAHALGLERDEQTRKTARSMVVHALEYGWDRENGGFFYGGSTFGDIFHEDKSWWVQAEGLNALLLMAREFPAERARFEARFLELWAYVKKYMLDADNGGWFPSGLDTGKDRRQAKASVWKAAYHNARALKNCVKMLREEP